MNTVFIAVLLMSATGALLVLSLALLRPVTRRFFNASWHYRVYTLVVLFLLIPIGTVGGDWLTSVQSNAVSELPSVPVILNDMITAPQNYTVPQQSPSLAAAPAFHEITPKPAVTFRAISAYLPLVWLVGVVIFAIGQGVRLIRFKRKITRTSMEIEDETTLCVSRRQMNELKIKSKLYLMSNDMVKTPMLTGLFKTYLIMPEVEMSERELAVILKHELIHLKRRDLWVKSLALLANAIHWFNPAAYRLTKQIDVHCELSCDERVVAGMSAEERQFYGETILNVLCRVISGYSGVYATLAESKKGIKQRLTHMMNAKTTTKRVALISLAVAALLCLTGFAVSSVMNRQKDPAPVEAQETPVADNSEDSKNSGDSGNLPLQAPEQELGYDIILQGNLSDFEGVWENTKGEQITLKSNGTLFDDYTEEGITYKEKAGNFAKHEDGSYTWGVSLENYGQASGYRVWFYPIGVEVWSYGMLVSTDTTKVRLYAGHDFLPDMTGAVYYLRGKSLSPVSPDPSIRTETITLEGFDEQIQTKLYYGDGWLLYYDFERYELSTDGDKTILYAKNDTERKYAYAGIEHITNISEEEELRLRTDETTVNIVSDGEGGCYVLSLWYSTEAAEGHGVRLGYMLDSFTPLMQKDTLPPTLDENGRNDDTVQLLGNATGGWYADGVELTVTLGNGNTYSKFYDESCRGPSLLYADLTSDGFDEIILVLPNATSNYAATNVHVLSAVNGELAEILTVLCTPTQEDIDKYAQTWLGVQDFLCTGASVVSFNGKPALRIEQMSRRDSAYTIIRWDSGKWVTEPRQIEKYFLYSYSWSTDMTPQPLPMLDESQVIRTLVTEKTEGFTQTVYRSKNDEDSGWNFHSYIETGGIKYDLGHIGYGGDDYFENGLKTSVFGKFMDIDGVTLYTQHKWYGASYDAVAFYEIINGVPCLLYEIENATAFYQEGTLLTVLSSSRSQPLNIVLFGLEIANGIILTEDLRALLGCWAVGYNFEQKLVYAYEENNGNEPVAVYSLEGLVLVKQY